MINMRIVKKVSKVIWQEAASPSHHPASWQMHLSTVCVLGRLIRHV